jgi:hypothetical protein
MELLLTPSLVCSFEKFFVDHWVVLFDQILISENILKGVWNH